MEEANVVSAPGILGLLQVRDCRCCLNQIVLDWKVCIVETGLNGTGGAVVVVNKGDDALIASELTAARV
jgi:hypothetical protein